MTNTRKVASVTLKEKVANPATASQYKFLEKLCDENDNLCTISQWMKRMPKNVASALISRKQSGQKIIIN